LVDQAVPLFEALLKDRDAPQKAEILHWLLSERARPQLALGFWRDAMARGAVWMEPRGWCWRAGAFDWLSRILGDAYTGTALRGQQQGAKLGPASNVGFKDWTDVYVVKKHDLEQTLGAISELRSSRVPCLGPADDRECHCGKDRAEVKQPGHVVVFADEASTDARQTVALETLASGLRAGDYCNGCAEVRSGGDLRPSPSTCARNAAPASTTSAARRAPTKHLLRIPPAVFSTPLMAPSRSEGWRRSTRRTKEYGG
jgi:hypothetical protein